MTLILGEVLIRGLEAELYGKLKLPGIQPSAWMPQIVAVHRLYDFGAWNVGFRGEQVRAECLDWIQSIR